MTLIEVHDLAIEFEGRNVVHDISMKIEAGEIVTLIGPNGAGKSSLVRALIGAVKTKRGSIRRDAGLRMGYVPQNLASTSHMPMNVRRFLQGFGRVNRQKRAQIIEVYGVEPLLDLPLAKLSGGEMRRVLFAHALLDAPNLLILDEPTAGLDMAGTARFYEFIEDLRQRENMAVLLVSHDLNIVMKNSDRVICINGHICCQGTPSDVSLAPEYSKVMGLFEPVALYQHHHDHSHDHAEDMGGAE